MHDNEPLLCFTHCDCSTDLIVLQLPAICPLCKSDLATTPMIVPPFRVPSPLVHSRQAPYSVVIKTTKGSFFSKDFNNDTDLHVGVTDSRGVVYDYSEQGVGHHKDGWSQCMAIPAIKNTNYMVTPLWNPKLAEFSAYDKWTSEKFTLEKHNCYEFAVGFLQLMDLKEEIPSIQSQSLFCSASISPLMTRLARYLTLFHQVQQKEVVIKKQQENQDHSTYL